jgi:hypothetical protein
MTTTTISLRFTIISVLILFAAFSRLLPHPPNFAPIGAMALFGAAYFSQRYLTFFIPIISMWLADLFLNNIVYGHYFDHFVWFYQGFYWTYGAFILIGLIGFLVLKRIQVQNLIIASLLASFIFFLVSNFGVWASTAMYTKSFSGLLTCYTAAIPFFRNTLMGDLVYTGVLFGVFEYAQFKFPVLRYNTVSPR